MKQLSDGVIPQDVPTPLVRAILDCLGDDVCVSTQRGKLKLPAIIITEPEKGELHCDVVRKCNKADEQPNCIFSKSCPLNTPLLHASIA